MSVCDVFMERDEKRYAHRVCCRPSSLHQERLLRQTPTGLVLGQRMARRKTTLLPLLFLLRHLDQRGANEAKNKHVEKKNPGQNEIKSMYTEWIAKHI